MCYRWEKSEEGETSQSSTPGPTAAAAASAEKAQVTSEVLKRAENAIFKKAINAIRPERKKRRSERKVFVEKKEGEKSTTTKPASESDEAVPEPNKVTIQVSTHARGSENKIHFKPLRRILNGTYSFPFINILFINNI